MNKKDISLPSVLALVSLSVVGALASSASAAADVLPTVEPPRGFSEGTETQMTEDQMAEILPWATTTETALNDLLETATALSYSEAKETLLRGIQEVVLASAPKRTELITRYVLNRALLVNAEIEAQADVSQPGVIDMQVRLLKLSVQLAKKYYASDLAYLNGRFVERKADLAGLPFAEFGIEYADFLMSIDQSLFDASAQYTIGVLALGLLQWDLYRDQDRLLLAPVIAKINRFVKMAPQRAGSNDPETVKWVRKVKKTYLGATSEAAKLLKQAKRSVPAPSHSGSSSGNYRIVGSIKRTTGAVNFDFQAGDTLGVYLSCIKLHEDANSAKADLMTVSVDLSPLQTFTTAYWWYTQSQVCQKLAQAAGALGVPVGTPSSHLVLVTLQAGQDMTLSGRNRSEIFEACTGVYNHLGLAGKAIDGIDVAIFPQEPTHLSTGGWWRTSSEVCLQIANALPN